MGATALGSASSLAGIIAACVVVAGSGSAAYTHIRKVRSEHRTPEQVTLYGDPGDPMHGVEPTPGVVADVKTLKSDTRDLKSDVAEIKRNVQSILNETTRNGGGSMRDTMDLLRKYLDDQKGRPGQEDHPEGEKA